MLNKETFKLQIEEKQIAKKNPKTNSSLLTNKCKTYN